MGEHDQRPPNLTAKDSSNRLHVPSISLKRGKRHRTSPLILFPADFFDAHRRHWKDAELLWTKDRWPNADHLYGISAECGLKSVMCALGMETDESGVPVQDKHRVHVNKLWSEFQTLASGKSGGDFAAELGRRNPFFKWHISSRYANSDCIDATTAHAHREAAARVRTLVAKCAAEGTLNA